MLPVPRRLRDFDAPWLGEALAAAGLLGDARVRAVERERMGLFSSELWRLRPAYDGPTAAPESLVLKQPRPDAKGERRALADRLFDAEIGFYRTLASEAPGRVPRCIFAARHPDGEAVWLLLEEVPTEPVDFLAGADAGHARLAVELLAGVHGHFAGRVAHAHFAPRLADIAVRTELGREFDAAWRARRELLLTLGDRGAAPLGDALQGRVAESLAPLGAPETLLHGDAHFENLPRIAGTPDALVALDWAGTRRGAPGFDLAVFASMSFPVKERRRVERELVARHADTVERRGLALDDPWRDYRRGALLRVVDIAILADRLPAATHQPGTALAMVLRRSFAAAVELDCVELVV